MSYRGKEMNQILIQRLLYPTSIPPVFLFFIYSKINTKNNIDTCIIIIKQEIKEL